MDMHYFLEVTYMRHDWMCEFTVAAILCLNYYVFDHRYIFVMNYMTFILVLRAISRHSNYV